MQAQVVRIHQHGGPDALRWEAAEVAAPAANEALVRVVACGLNFIDVYHREGLYPVELPAVLGLEGAGYVEAVGSAVKNVKEGDAVGYCVAGLGAYATHRVVKANRLIPLPAGVEPEQAAAMLLKGMTAEYLIRRVYAARAGDTVLFYAAAGGVGLIACQWLKQLGARVIGVVGSQKKAELALANGCEHVLQSDEDIAARAREITGGRGVEAVYDSVGKDTFEASLNALAPRGMFVSYGNASGPAPAFAPGLLAEKGSLFFTRPTLMTYCASDEDMLASAEALFFAARAGAKILIGQRFPLQEAQAAHRALQARQTVGSTILTCE